VTYLCPMNPPHVDGRGDPIAHKNRKECIAMGRANRGKPLVPAKAVAPPEPAQAVAPPEPAQAVAPPEPAQAVAPPETPVTPPVAVKGKKTFKLFKRKAEVAPEAETQKEAQAAQPAWVLPEEPTIMFWTTVMSLFKGAIEFIDKGIKAEHPYDTKQLEFTTSEQAMIGEAMPGLTTRLLKWMGVKSVEQATGLIHGMVILRIFGRIFLSVGIHFYDEAKIKAKRKRDEKEAEELLAKQHPAEAVNAPNTPQSLG
jgi:hypothetical protein